MKTTIEEETTMKILREEIVMQGGSETDQIVIEKIADKGTEVQSSIQKAEIKVEKGMIERIEKEELQAAAAVVEAEAQTRRKSK